MDQIVFGRVRRLFAELDARTRIAVWWNGAAADRLLDEQHAALGEVASLIIGSYGWLTPVEVTYSKFGERGSIDIFAHRQEREAVAVCEVKSAIGSLEEMNRSVDTKVRLAPAICRERFGWTPRYVGRLVVLPSASTARRVVAAHAQTMNGVFPARGREIRAWLRRPDRNFGGIWFLSNPRDTQKVAVPEP